MVDDSRENSNAKDAELMALLRDAKTSELQFLRDEGFEFLASCRAIQSSSVRRAILTMLRALADRPSEPEHPEIDTDKP